MKDLNHNIDSGSRHTKSKKINGTKICLRTKKMSDVRTDYKWQSDPELARLDAAPQISTSFAIYLLDYATEIRHPRRSRYPMAIETLDGKHIGNCTCYDIDEKKSEAQLGIMIGDRDYWDQGYGADAITTMINLVFRTSNLQRLYLKTLDWNLRAQKCFRNCGFTECGYLKRDGMNFLLMELKRKQWEERQGNREKSATEI